MFGRPLFDGLGGSTRVAPDQCQPARVGLLNTSEGRQQKHHVWQPPIQCSAPDEIGDEILCRPGRRARDQEAVKIDH